MWGHTAPCMAKPPRITTTKTRMPQPHHLSCPPHTMRLKPCGPQMPKCPLIFSCRRKRATPCSLTIVRGCCPAIQPFFYLHDRSEPYLQRFFLFLTLFFLLHPPKNILKRLPTGTLCPYRHCSYTAAPQGMH